MSTPDVSVMPFRNTCRKRWINVMPLWSVPWDPWVSLQPYPFFNLLFRLFRISLLFLWIPQGYPVYWRLTGYLVVRNVHATRTVIAVVLFSKVISCRVTSSMCCSGKFIKSMPLCEWRYMLLLFFRGIVLPIHSSTLFYHSPSYVMDG